jgi:triosephosphate isomerase
MHYNPAESRELVQKLLALAGDVTDREVVIIPPFTSLPIVAELVRNTRFKLGGQNMHWEKKGAFTGEVSGAFLKAVGCDYVIIGHSERRHLMNETDDQINRKLKAGLEIGLVSIFCVGETGPERDGNRTEEVILRQLDHGLKDIREEIHKIIIAYEPVWAIGTGRTATPQQAADVHRFIRRQFPKPVTILYGGSVKADNIDALMAEKDLNGVLVGGASLKPEEFARVIKFVTH